MKPLTKISPEELQRRRARQRRVTRLALLALLLCGLFLGGLMYFETTSLAPGRAALVLRGGELQRVVSDAGHVYRVPFLDRIVLVDLRPQPLPTFRRTLAGSDGVRVVAELRTTWRVADASAYWRQLKASPEAAARLIETEIDAALPKLAAQSAAISTRDGEGRRGEALARALGAAIAPALQRAGLAVAELRFTSMQVLR